MLLQAEKETMENLRGCPLEVGTFEELIDDHHAIVSVHEHEHYVAIMSFVNRDLLVLGCTVLLQHKVQACECYETKAPTY